MELTQQRFEAMTKAYRNKCHEAEIYRLALEKVEKAISKKFDMDGKTCRPGTILAMLRHTLGMSEKGE